MAKREIVAFALLAAFMVGNVHLLRVVDASMADALIMEDGFFEILGAVCLVFGAVFAFATLLRLRSSPDTGRIRQLCFLGIVLILVLAAGEELSWGQRLLGYETPSPIAEVNVQKEFNIHNLYGDATGQNVSELLYKAFWVSFGVVVPLLALMPRVGALIRRHLPVVPVWLALLFVGQQLLWQPVRAEWRADPGAWNATYRGYIGGEPFRVETPADATKRGVSVPSGLGEVMEANVQVLIMVGTLCLLLGARRHRDAPPVSAAAAAATGSGPGRTREARAHSSRSSLSKCT